MSKKEALLAIEKNINQMRELLKESQNLADEHGLKFSFLLDTPQQNKNYSSKEVEGKYIGIGSEGSYQGKPEPSEGYWYWQNSSLNC